jgi:hypothetical protein
MYPHERSLVEKFQNKPFVILGINSDSSRELVKKVSIKEKLTWRSFLDGGSTYGPIASQWNVSGWPTLYLIDHKGLIVGMIGGINEKDDKLIEEKVSEAEKERKK